MRRWFEIGLLPDGTYAAKEGDIQFLQLPQKKEFIAWANSLVGVAARLTTGAGDPSVCDGVGALHLINSPGCTEISSGGELRGLMLFQGVPPVFQGLCRQYFEKPGINDGPNDTQTVEKPRGGTQSKGGNLQISLRSYLLLLLQTWSGIVAGPSGKFIPGTGGVPQRWLDWLALLISHYDRYTPTQIYGFLARVDFREATFKV